MWELLGRSVGVQGATGFRLMAFGLVNRKVNSDRGLTGDSTVISTLGLLVVVLSFEFSFIRFLNNHPSGVRESPPELGSFRGSNFVLSVDEVLDEEALAVEVEEDDEDDGDILDSGDLPGFLGRGAAIISSVTGGGGSGAGLTFIPTGEEDTVSNG